MKSNRKLTLILLVLGLSLLASACSGQNITPTSWPAATLKDGTLYVAYNTAIYALNPETGAESTRYPAETERGLTFFTTPVFTADGQMIATTYNNRVISFNLASGAFSDFFTMERSRFIGTPLVTEDAVYIPDSDHHLYALSTSGSLQWTFEAQDGLWASPISDGCCVYQSGLDHYLYAIPMNNTEKAEAAWALDLGGTAVNGPVLGPDNLLYIGTFNNEMLGVNPENGRIEWRMETADWVWGSAAVTDEGLYFGDLDGNVYAVDIDGHETRWQANVDGAVTGAPLVTEDSVYVASEAGKLFAFNREDGSLRWERGVNEAKMYGTPVEADGLVIVSLLEVDQLLVAYDANGTLQWEFTPEN